MQKTKYKIYQSLQRSGVTKRKHFSVFLEINLQIFNSLSIVDR